MSRERSLVMALVVLALLAGLTAWIVIGPDSPSAPVRANAPTDSEDSTPNDTTPPPDTASVTRTRRHTPAPDAPPAPDANRGRAEGRVVRGEAPAAGVEVRLVRDDPLDQLELATVATDAEGVFRFDGVPLGPYRAVAVADEAKPNGERDAHIVVTDAESVPVVIDLSSPDAEAGLDVRGHVTHEEPPGHGLRVGFSLMSDGDDQEFEVIVDPAGKFRVWLPHPGTYYVIDLSVDGESIDSWSQVEVQEGREIEVRVHPLRTARVRVVDEATGDPLAGARLFKAQFDPETRMGFQAGWTLPNPVSLRGEPVVAGPDGRAELPLERGTSDWCISAEGYAWRSVSVPHLPEETLIGLVRGGSLDLRILNWEAAKDARVYLTSLPEYDRSMLGSPGEDGELHIDGLRPGEIEVKVQRGVWFERGREFAKARTQIVAGTRTALTLLCDPGESPPVVEVRGVIVASEDWGSRPDRVEFDIESDSDGMPDRSIRVGVSKASDGTMSFGPVNVPAGLYRVTVRPMLWRRRFEIVPGMKDLKLDLGPPGQMSVSVVDAVTGKAVRGANLWWSTRLENQSSWSVEHVSSTPDGTPFVVQVPAGEVHIDVDAPGYVDPEERTVTIAPGKTSDVEIRLEPGGSLRVELRIDGRPYPAEAEVEIRPVRDDANWSRSTSSDSGTYAFDGLAAGTYVVTVEDLVGFETPAPRQVSVAVRETSELVIDLLRKR